MNQNRKESHEYKIRDKGRSNKRIYRGLTITTSFISRSSEKGKRKDRKGRGGSIEKHGSRVKHSPSYGPKESLYR